MLFKRAKRMTTTNTSVLDKYKLEYEDIPPKGKRKMSIRKLKTVKPRPTVRVDFIRTTPAPKRANPLVSYLKYLVEIILK